MRVALPRNERRKADSRWTFPLWVTGVLLLPVWQAGCGEYKEVEVAQLNAELRSPRLDYVGEDQEKYELCEGHCGRSSDCEDRKTMMCRKVKEGKRADGCRGKAPQTAKYCIPREDSSNGGGNDKSNFLVKVGGNWEPICCSGSSAKVAGSRKCTWQEKKRALYDKTAGKYLQCPRDEQEGKCWCESDPDEPEGYHGNDGSKSCSAGGGVAKDGLCGGVLYPQTKYGGYRLVVKNGRIHTENDCGDRFWLNSVCDNP